MAFKKMIKSLSIFFLLLLFAISPMSLFANEDEATANPNILVLDSGAEEDTGRRSRRSRDRRRENNPRTSEPAKTETPKTEEAKEAPIEEVSDEKEASTDAVEETASETPISEGVGGEPTEEVAEVKEASETESAEVANETTETPEAETPVEESAEVEIPANTTETEVAEETPADITETSVAEETTAATDVETAEKPAEVKVPVRTPEEIKNQQLLDQIVKQKALLEQSRAIKGQAAFAEGLAEYKKFQFEQALQYFRQAEVYLPNDVNVKKHIKLCAQQLGMSQSNSIKMKFITEGRDVYNQELMINIQHHLAKVDEKLAKSKSLWLSPEKKFKAEAQRVVNEAELELRKAEDSTNLLRGWEGKQNLIKLINQKDGEIKKMLVVYRKYFKERIAEDARLKAKQLSESAAKDREYKIDALLLQAKREYLNKNYPKAIRICNIILKKELHHDGALLILKKSRDKRDRIALDRVKMKSKEEWKKNIEKIEKASIFYSDTVVYPDNWADVSRRKAVQIRKTYQPEWLKQLTQKMKARVSLSLPENSLQEIVEMLQEQTGVNFRIDPKLDLEDATVSNIDLKDIPLDSALAIVLKNISTDEPLWYNMRDGAIFISDQEGQQAIIAKLETVSYDVTDLITSWSDQAGGESAGLGNGIQTIADNEDGAISMEVLIGLIQKSIDPISWEVEGVTAEPYDTGIILISQTSLVHEKISELLSKFRNLQKLQVSIEVRFISSSEDDIFDMDIGLSGQNDVPLEDSGVNVGSAIFSSRSDLDTDTRVATVLGSAADNAVSGAPDFISLNRAAEGLFTEVSVLDPIRASLVFHALSRKQNIKDLIAPRLTVLNNKTGFFRRQVVTTYVASVSSANGGSTPQPGVVNSGIQLEVRPTVSSDRKYVTLTLTPVVTQLINLATREIRFVSGGTNNNNQNTGTQTVTSATIEIPEVENWQLQTTAQVPDGGVLFVGGRMGHTENKVTRGVPLISKIPLLGRLFRTDGEFTRFDNLIISVRAKILIFEEMENKL
jgi:hypothetical protein